MIHKRLEEVEKQMEALQNTLNTLKYKCWYYDTATAAGTEAAVKNLSPADIRAYKLWYRRNNQGQAREGEG